MRIFTHANYNFIKWRWHALIFSIVIIWAGVGTIFLRGGIPMGIEFRRRRRRRRAVRSGRR